MGVRLNQLYRRTSSRPIMWSACECVNRMASMRRRSWRSAWERRSGVVSTSTRIPSSQSIAMEGRVRESRGSVDRQTSQSQPIIGTPWDVPVPRKSTRTDDECNIARVTRPPRRSNARERRAARAFARLVRIMDILRSTRGCPWDRKQTAATLRPFLLEETYEAIEAIDRGDMAELE